MKKSHIISLIQKKRPETAAKKEDDKMVGYVEAIHASSSEGSAVAPDTKPDTKRPAKKFRRHPIGGGWAYATSLGLPDQTSQIGVGTGNSNRLTSACELDTFRGNARGSVPERATYRLEYVSLSSRIRSRTNGNSY